MKFPIIRGIALVISLLTFPHSHCVLVKYIKVIFFLEVYVCVTSSVSLCYGLVRISFLGTFKKNLRPQV